MNEEHTCFCKEPTTHLKLEGDVGAEPIWCGKCGANLDVDVFPISEDLKCKLMDWGFRYGEWMDWEKDRLQKGAKQMEEAFNREGSELLEKISREIGRSVKVEYVPSTMVRHYEQK
ncbi:hypothetical protein [Pseudalkalibacillus sp. SCS-8]|uniref:hypothetical protein n=1 Tax=Pseudalkalibacillus nanhaiensis TaxID=3115291 RepID=UPI0032DAF071